MWHSQRAERYQQSPVGPRVSLKIPPSPFPDPLSEETANQAAIEHTAQVDVEAIYPDPVSSFSGAPSRPSAMRDTTLPPEATARTPGLLT